MCVSQNWTNLEKRSPFPQFSSKLSEIFLVKDLTKFLQAQSFGEHTFLAKMGRLKNA